MIIQWPQRLSIFKSIPKSTIPINEKKFVKDGVGARRQMVLTNQKKKNFEKIPIKTYEEKFVKGGVGTRRPMVLGNKKKKFRKNMKKNL